MRKPDTIEHAYLDFDSFFASVEQQRRPWLRGRPVGIRPTTGNDWGGVIAASKEAKAAGVRGVMSRRDALKVCPDIQFVSQDPAMYRRAHNAAVSSVKRLYAEPAVKSIDEMAIRLDSKSIADPHAAAARIKAALAEDVGPFVTCSIGFAPNRHLAKVACSEDKPDGAMVWRPEDLPDALLHIPLRALPGIGSGMEKRLAAAGITDMAGLLATQPKQLRRIWGNVAGERFWYVMQGYEVQVPKSSRSMIGHGRVLPAEWRGLDKPYGCARMLTVKAARRLRRQDYFANRFYLGVKLRAHPGAEPRGWATEVDVPAAQDDYSALDALKRCWARLPVAANAPINVAHVMISFSGLVKTDACQLDLWRVDNPQRKRWQTLTETVDGLNRRYCKSAVTLGPWMPPPGGNAGGKIAFTRIPEVEDFW